MTTQHFSHPQYFKSQLVLNFARSVNKVQDRNLNSDFRKLDSNFRGKQNQIMNLQGRLESVRKFCANCAKYYEVPRMIRLGPADGSKTS